MKFQEAKTKYIETWGGLATQWGINRTMAQIHALLLITPTPLSCEQIMEELHISRGNANMNIRALLDWNIIDKKFLSGDRKEYFIAKKDIWELFKQITKERRKREITPMLETLEELKKIKTKDNESQEFVKVVTDISSVTKKINKMVDGVIKSDEQWFSGKLMDLFKK